MSRLLSGSAFREVLLSSLCEALFPDGSRSREPGGHCPSLNEKELDLRVAEWKEFEERRLSLPVRDVEELEINLLGDAGSINSGRRSMEEEVFRSSVVAQQEQLSVLQKWR